MSSASIVIMIFFVIPAVICSEEAVRQKKSYL